MDLANSAANDGHKDEAAPARHGQINRDNQEALITGQYRGS